MPDVATATPANPTETTPGGSIKRVKGRLLLTLDVTQLHGYLRALGVDTDGNGYFVAFPPNLNRSGARDIDPNTNAVQPSALCRTTYAKINGKAPNIATDRLTLEWDLSQIYGTPVTEAGLKVLAGSVAAARDAIVQHYAPVEIGIVISPLKRAELIEAHPVPVPATVATPARATPPDDEDHDDDEE